MEALLILFVLVLIISIKALSGRTPLERQFDLPRLPGPGADGGATGADPARSERATVVGPWAKREVGMLPPPGPDRAGEPDGTAVPTTALPPAPRSPAPPLGRASAAHEPLAGSAEQLARTSSGRSPSLRDGAAGSDDDRAEALPARREPRPLDEARREAIRAIVEERRIRRVVHFTPRENLDAVSRHGLLSRNELERRGLEARIVDNLRRDRRLDRISLSISFPNNLMFFKKREELRDVGDWVVLAFRPELLWELDCLFSPANAACKAISKLTDEELRSPEAFRKMFEGERDPLWPRNYTTDPQAEVLVHDRVPLEYLEKVIVFNRTDPPEIEKLLINAALEHVRAECEKTMFDQRYDIRRHWRRERRRA